MPYTIEYRIIHPEHGLRTLFSRGAPVLNENNEVEKLKGITQDITERKTIEKELNESQKFIRAITESVPNIIFVYDVLNDKEIYSNRTLASTLGYTKAEAKAMGKNIMKTLVHPDDFGALQERNNNIISYGRKNKVFEVFYKIKHANGNWRWHRSLSKIFKYNSKGLPWQILGVTEDVTDRKLADDKLQKAYVDMQNMNLELAHAKGLLKESNNELEQRVEERTKELSDIINQLKNTAGEQQKFAALVEKSINFISMSDLEGNIIYLNDGGMKLVGLESKEEALQTRIKDYFFEKDHDLVYDKPFQSIGNWQQWSGEFYLKHFKTGEPIPVFSNAFRIEDPATGEILALANVSHDLTDHKKKEEEIRSSREKLESINIELNRKNEELIKINIDLDNFVYTASHDLKSPISNLEGLLLALDKPLKQKPGSQEKQIIQMMHKSVFKLKDTISALVEITKAQRNLEETTELVSITEVLDEVRLEIDKLIVESNAKFFLDITIDRIVYAKINLHSIMYNLITNAIKYRDSKKALEIHIRTYKENDIIVFSIRDNGLGIHNKQQGKLFGMFRRFHSHVEGTGIGLYIIKRMVENNNGKIEVESEEGVGTCFKIYFKEQK
jgi:PAS domain S-box-containing protein